MAVFKVLFEIQGQLFDLWNLKTLQRAEEYNERFSRMDYILWLNKDAMILEYKDVKFVYSSKRKRDIDYARIKDCLNEYETVIVLADENSQPEPHSDERQFEDLDDLSAEELAKDNEEE